MLRYITLLVCLLGWDIHAEEKQPLYYIAIIDRFYPPIEGFLSEEDKVHHTGLYGLVDIDNDRRKEAFYHGDIVQLIASDPSFVFLRYPLTGQQSPMREILNALTSINDRFAATPIDALILSWESSTLMSAFNEPLVRDRREHYIQMIQQWGHEFPSWQETYLVIRALEQLARQGATVYTISGNSGPRTINTLSFAEGVTTVGAVEQELNYFITDNAFVDVYEQAAYHLRRVDDASGVPVGYDITGNGCKDIPIEALSSHNYKSLPPSIWPPIKGSSFAAPMALKKALLQETTRCRS